MIRLLSKYHFTSGRLANVAIFNTKKYDIEFFDKINNSLSEDKQLNLLYFEEQLNDHSAKLAEGCDSVWQLQYHPILFLSCFVNDKVNARVLKTLHNHGVNLIALRCAGYNNVDLKTAFKLNFRIARVPSYSPEAVAEHAMALLLAVNRKIHKAYNRTRDGNFALDGLLGQTLSGKTIGVIGTGIIGQCFIRICRGFGMNVLCYDIKPNEKLVQELNVKYVSENEIFSNSNIISLHCPLTPQTKHLVNAHSLSLLKPKAIIINTGRGALIDTKAVIRSLKAGELGGLAIDVYEQEERLFFKDVSADILADDILARLLSFNNVIVTGHQAFFTSEAIHNICNTTLNNIISIRMQQSCPNEIILN